MFRAFPGYDITRAAAETPSDVSEAMESLDIRSVSHTRQLGFLNLVSDVTKQLGSLVLLKQPLSMWCWVALVVFKLHYK